MFKGGCLAKTLERWESITSDQEILETISGMKISTLNFPTINHRNYPVYNRGRRFIDEEINKLLINEEGEYISPIFITEKSDGGFRLILNLKELKSLLKRRNLKCKH